MALLCNHYRVNYVYLGTSVSAESLGEVAQSLDSSHAIVLGNPNPMASTENTESYIKIFKNLSPNTHLLLQGQFVAESLSATKIDLFQDIYELDRRLRQLSSDTP